MIFFWVILIAFSKGAGICRYHPIKEDFTAQNLGRVACLLFVDSLRIHFIVFPILKRQFDL